MKKLIAMIGAVATAFGLYAAEPAKFATSFEANEPGVEGTTFTPGTGWTWGSEDALTLGTYDGDKYVYGTGAFARRDSEFTVGLDSQVNYLKLETGTNALSRAVGGNVFLDQLVKFTGFEEYQTNVVAGTKIAVWMSGIETEGTAQIGTPQIGTPQIGTPAQGVEGEDGYVPASPDYQPASPDYQPASPDYQPASSDYIAGETNLYITCAKVVDGQVQTNALKIAGSYELDKWYRLTIKSIGDIYDADKRQSEDPRAGFIVYVDGNQVAAVDDAATTLIEYDSEMTAAAKGYMAAKQLFPAIDNTDATFATVGYQGIGAIDDIILDTDGPEFARTVDVTAEALGIQGAKIVKVTQDGEIVTGEGVWKVKAGNIVVWYAPDGAYVFKGDGDATATWTVSGDGAEMVEDSQTFEVAEAVAKIVNVATPTEVTYIDEDDLAELTGLANGDTATILKSCEIQDEEENTLYSFTPNTTISVAEGGIWNIFIDKWVFDNKGVLADKAGELYDNFGLLASKTVNVTFGEKVGNNLCTLYIEGAIAGNITAGDNGVVVINNDGVETTLSGTITAANVEVADDVTLVENGKLITTDDSIESILDGEGIAVVPTADTPEEGWYTYALATEPETYEVMVAEPVEHCTVKVEISDLEPAYEGGKYEAPIDATVVVTYTPDEDYEITDGQAVWTFTAESEVFETTAPSVAQSIDPVAKIGDKEFASLAEAFASDAAKVAGAKVELVTNIELSAELEIVDFNGTLDLGGYELSSIDTWKAPNVRNNVYDWLIDAYVSDASKTSSLVITNGTITLKDGHMLYVCCNTTLTVASDATIHEIGFAWLAANNDFVPEDDDDKVRGCANPLRTYGKVGGRNGTGNNDLPCTINVYGTIIREAGNYTDDGEQGWIDQCLGKSVINVYEGAVLTHAGRGFKMSGGIPTVNVYGGTMTAGSGSEMFHAYSGGGANTIHIEAGTFTMGKFFSGSGYGKTIVLTGLDENCTAKFSSIENTANKDGTKVAAISTFCASGYSPKLADSWYTIAENPTVIAANVGNKGTLTVTGAGEKVAYGSTITGTLTDVADGYNAFVFVDGQKVTVGQDGAFEGIANGSANVAAVYVKDTTWFIDPFARNINNAGVPNENSQSGAIDETAGKVFLGTSPGNSSSGIAQYDIAKLIAGFGENIDPDTAFAQTGAPEYYGRGFAVAPKYEAVIGGNAKVENQMIVYPYGGPWSGDDSVCYTVTLEGLGDGDFTKYLPIAIDQDSQYLYGIDYVEGTTVVQFQILADADDSTKIGKLVKVQTWTLPEESDCGLEIARIGGKDIIYTAYGSNSPIFIIDTATGAVKKVPLQHNGAAYQLKVGGVADETPYLLTVSGKAIEVFPLTADGLDLAATTPTYTVVPKDIVGAASDFNRVGFVLTADGENAFMAYGRTFPKVDGQKTAVATIEKKPANLIVRGKFVTDDEVDQPVDITPEFGAAVEQTFTAPEGYEISAVTVNGAAVTGFTAADSYTFTSAALDAYTLVKMTIAQKTYDLTFTVNDAPVYTTNDVVYGTAFADVAPADPTVEGKSFTGWTPVVETIVADNTFTAQFTNNYYKVEFYTNTVLATTVEYEYDATDVRKIVLPTIEGVTAWSNEQYTAEFEFHSNIADTQKAYAVIAEEEQGVEPGAVVPANDKDDAEKKAAEMKIVPGELDAPAEYYKGVAKQDAQGGWYVEADVNPAMVTAEIKTEEEEKPIEVTATEFKAVVKDAIPGLFYGFVATEALGGTNEFAPVVESFVRATVEGVTLKAPKGTGNAKFFKISVRAKAPAVEPVTD